ncbi:MAG: cytochrome c biogenesis protein ResB [Myxococcales bacterium]|nr:cytochrome c biogenesis protein ResB [Myxococcales bacterium]
MGDGNQKKTGLLQDAIDWLASLRVTVYTLITLGLATLCGTVFPQLDVTMPREVLIEKLHDPAWRIYHLLGLTDVFHSVWFLFLVILLILNLTACTIAYIRRTRRLLANAEPTLDKERESGASFVKRIADSPLSVEQLTALMRPVGTVRQTEKNGAIHLFAQNSPWLRYAIVVVHFSILLVVAGALVKLFAGIEGQMMLPEGGSQNVFLTKNGDLMRLPFDVRCDQFTVEFYAGSKRPKEFRSWLSLWQDGRKLREKSIVVNDPLRQGLYRFFQASYGRQEFPLIQLKGEGLDTTLPVVFQQIQSLPGKRDGLVVDDARKNAEGATEVHVVLQSGGREAEAWLAQNAPPLPVGPYTLAFAGAKQGYYTGLLVTADPSAGLLWAGFGLFFVGLLLTMYTSHKRVWARVEGKSVTVAGTATRHREAMREWLEKTAEKIAKG